MKELATLALSMALLAAPVSASAQAAVSAGTGDIPDLSFTPTAEATKNFWKYNYFHKSGVSFGSALRDLRECRIRSAVSGLGLLNAFVPYGPTGGGPAARANLQYAGMIGQLAASGFMERNRRSNMRVCMGYKGYAQYGLPKEIWQKVNPGDEAKGDAIQARIASGPTPVGERME